MPLPPTAPRLLLHADESCLGNQFQDRDSPGGAAGLVEHWRGDHWVRRDFWLSEPGTTNNRMALKSAIVGLAALRMPCRIRFVSDSQYLVKGMNEWIHGWKRRGWTRKSGPIENLELWKELDQVAARHEITWAWVKGHAGHPRNEYVNDLAIQAARDQTRSEGLVSSGFEAWLEKEQEKGRYRDVRPSASPSPGELP